MSGTTIRMAALAVLALPLAAQTAFGQGRPSGTVQAAFPPQVQRAAVSQAHYQQRLQAQAAAASYAANPVSPGQPMVIQGQRPGTTQSVVPAYPYLNAPMYTSPVQHVPYQVGGTFYTNQAFAPHEMLYAHKYRAIYPPYYYKVKGHWAVLPGGVWSVDNWELMGTEVEVTYRSRKPFYSLFATKCLH
jgi:hypothetical protein